MPYMPVDDKLHSHPKAIKAGVSAMGLWVLCGSWSNDLGTDGFVPDYIVSRFVARGRILAARLVNVGFWTVAEKNGERGWQFHQWAGDGLARRNFTRAEVEQRRREGAERQAKSRQRRSAQDWNVTRDSSVTNGVTDASRKRQSQAGHSDPSHPIPKPLNPVPLQAVELPTDEDRSEALETQNAPGQATPWMQLPKHRCEHHCQPDDKRCPACKTDFGDQAHYAKLRAKA